MMRAASPASPASLVLSALALVCAAAALLAAPLPEVRALPPSLRARLAPSLRPDLPLGLRFPCGARPEGAADVLIENAARTLASPLPTPHSTDAGEIALLEDDGTLIYANKGGDTVLDLAQAARAFYRTHGDDYDVVAFYLASGLSTWLGSPTALAAAFPIRNQVQGIGLGAFDLGGDFGSASRLQAILSMNGLHKYLDDPDAASGPDQFTPLDFLAHELGHRWLAYVYVDSAGTQVPALLGRDESHWSFFFDCDASVMEGCDWAMLPADSFVTDSVTVGYGATDLYLMGLASPAETDSFFVVNDPSEFDPPGIYVPYSVPTVGVGCRGRATWWHVDDIVNANGARVPDASAAPHAFRMALALVVARDSAASAADLTKLEALRSQFGPYFARATRYRGTMDLSLDSHAGSVCITHVPLPDLESASVARPVGARVSIAQAGIPLAVDPGSVRLFWRHAGAGPYDEIPLSPAGADSFAATFPPALANGTIEYYLFAASDSTGIDAYDPPGGPAAPHAFSVGPDITPPTIGHVPVAAQGVARLPQTLLAHVTDGLGVDSVWVEYRVDGGPLLSAATSPAGRDSFTAALGGSLAQGQRLAYRILARDLAAAPNVAISNAAYDTLVAGRDWAHDFENGADGYIHMPYWYSYRDAWHLAAESSSPTGGTAWKCGGDEATDYPVHLDSNLYLPLLTDLVAGTVLRFDHRYGLEEAGGTWAWDGARLEISVNNGPWQILAPLAGYSHVLLHNSNPFVRGTPCWSGTSPGWRTETVDLTPYAPGPARVRFRMLADEFLGGLGWFVDRVRVMYPGATTAVPAASPRLAIGSPRPNPANAWLRQSVSVARETAGDWALYDLAGRRVATLWRGPIGAGGFELAAALPPGLRSGLYFTRITLAGRTVRSDRIAVIR